MGIFIMRRMDCRIVKLIIMRYSIDVLPHMKLFLLSINQSIPTETVPPFGDCSHVGASTFPLSDRGFDSLVCHVKSQSTLCRKFFGCSNFLPGGLG
jgi:hypothetical protein